MKIKRCNSCGKPLLSFAGYYLHPESPCSGISDGVEVNIEVMDRGLYERWEKEYGKPDKSDYEVRIIQEEDISALNESVKVEREFSIKLRDKMFRLNEKIKEMEDLLYLPKSHWLSRLINFLFSRKKLSEEVNYNTSNSNS